MLNVLQRLPTKGSTRRSEWEEGDDLEESRSAVVLSAASSDDQLRHDRKFSRAFLRTVKDGEEGLLTSHLFFDIPSNTELSDPFSGLAYDARRILSGGRAWDRHISDSSHKTGGNDYWNNDQKIISLALSEGVISSLPRSISLVSYGCGDAQAFENKETQIIRALMGDPGRQVTSFCAVDILERYAIDGALRAKDGFNIRSQGVVGDFLYNGRLAIQESRGIPVIMIFGGPFENTPITAQEPDAMETTAIAWAKINVQHGLGCFVIKTFDADQNADSQLARYAPTENFEAFVLSAFARAMHQGLIKPGYDVLSHWRMATEYDSELHAVKLVAECKKGHTLDILSPNGGTVVASRRLECGDRRTVVLSHKWDLETHRRIAARAGFELREVFESAGNPSKLIVAEAVKHPDSDLLAACYR